MGLRNVHVQGSASDGRCGVELPLAAPPGNVCYLRTAAGWSRREAGIANYNGGRPDTTGQMTTPGWRITLCGEVGEVDADWVFQGSIPAFYDEHLGPLLFVPYADDLASRLAEIQHGQILETAAGTGVLTRALVSSLPESVSIVATDLNQPMLDHASTSCRPRA